MGRYESQSAIAARTISERRHARKGGRKRHGGWLAWFMGRLAALAATITCVIALAALWPRPAATPPAPTPVLSPAPAKFGKAPFLAKLSSSPQRTARGPAHRPQPQAGAGGSRHSPTQPGYQVLSPDELAAISQAH